jgi:hypothetical protein
MFTEITYYIILGKPLIMYLGILTFLCFLTTASIGFLTITGIRRIPFKWHKRMAVISLTLALFHGALGILAYF